MASTKGILGENVAARFDERAESYDAQSLWVNEPKMVGTLLIGLPGHSRILEVGAGTGALALHAARAGHWIVCADISAGMLHQAKSKGLLAVRADMHSLPFPGRAFDVVLVRQALQYSNFLVALTEFRRVAAREIRIGQIVARDTEDQSSWRKLFDLMGQRARRVFTVGEIENIAAAGGFRINSVARMEGRERLVAPNLNADPGSMNWSAISDLMSRIDPTAVREQNEWIHKVAWEFVVLDCHRS